MRSLKISTDKNGSLLIELSIALAVGSITLTALSSLIINRQAYALKISQWRQDMFSAVSDMEKIKAADEKDLDNLEEIGNATQCLKIAKNSYFEKYIPKPNYARGIDGDCGGFFTNIFSIFLKPPNIYKIPNENLSGSIDVLKNIAVVGTKNDENSQIKIFNIANFQQLSSIESEDNINSIDLIQKRAFVARDGPNEQFTILNTENPANTEKICDVSLPGVAGSYPNAISVFYFDKKVYVGTHRTAGNEFHIFDAQIPCPAWNSSLEINHNINAVAAKNSYVFLATSGNSKNLIILDIGNPSFPHEISSLAFNGNEDSISIFLYGNILLIGRKKSTSASHPDFIIVDIKDPSLPKILSGIALKKDITGIRAISDYAFISTSDQNASFVAIDISDAQNPKVAHVLPLGEKALGIDIENDSVFIPTDQSFTKITPAI